MTVYKPRGPVRPNGKNVHHRLLLNNPVSFTLLNCACGLGLSQIIWRTLGTV
jgi:hypothetical protein